MMLALIINLLFVIIMLSAFINALQIFFAANDLEMLRAAPLAPSRAFAARFVETTVTSAWMSVLLASPAVAGLAAADTGPVLNALGIIPPLVGVAVIAASCGIILAFGATLWLPGYGPKHALISISLIAIVAFLVASGQALAAVGSQAGNGILSFPLISASWLPFAWLWRDSLLGSGAAYVSWMAFLCLAAAAAYLASFAIYRLGYERAYSRFLSRSRYNSVVHANALEHQLGTILPCPPYYRAMFSKEYRLFSRDPVQAIQLALLLFLCIVYLYDFTALRNAKADLPTTSRVWWEGLLVLCNMAMGTTLVAVVTARFVFPSVSLEGQSFPLLQAAPLSMHQILRSKFWSWLVPIATIAAVILAAGALAADASWHLVAITALCSLMICYGLVGLAVGMGARYAQFNWEHQAQVTSGLGCLLYSLLAFGLIIVNLMPVFALVVLRTIRLQGMVISTTTWISCVSTCALLIALINYATTSYTLSTGARHLERWHR